MAQSELDNGGGCKGQGQLHEMCKCIAEAGVDVVVELDKRVELDIAG